MVEEAVTKNLQIILKNYFSKKNDIFLVYWLELPTKYFIYQGNNYKFGKISVLILLFTFITINKKMSKPRVDLFYSET